MNKQEPKVRPSVYKLIAEDDYNPYRVISGTGEYTVGYIVGTYYPTSCTVTAIKLSDEDAELYLRGLV